MVQKRDYKLLVEGDNHYQPEKMVNLATKVQISRPAKLLALGALVLLIYLLYSYREMDKEISKGGEAIYEDKSSGYLQSPKIKKQVRVDVYYECLCPDSRYFVQHELLPAYNSIGDVLDVRLWPYGKATSTQSSSGEYQFECQHGPEECEGNIWHGCTARHVSSQSKRLEMIKCMINDNYDAPKVAKACAEEIGVSLKEISECATGEEGREIHYEAGLDTDQLNPKVSFIPTIKLDGSQGSQKAILKNFLKEVCKIYKEKYQEDLDGCPAPETF